LAVGFAFSGIYDAVKTLRKTHNQNKGKSWISLILTT
jgi:hypothetical protein